MNLFLIPIFGIAGAAIATLSSAFFNFILYLISSQKTYFIPFKYKEIIIYISVAFISITFMGFVDQNLFSKIIFALIFFTLLNFLANSLGVLDFKKVKDFLSNSNFKFKKF